MKVLVTTHGDLAHGLLDSYRMIIGNTDNIEALSLTNEGISVYRKKLVEMLGKITESEEVLILTDIKGGTPYNESFNYYLKYSDKVRIVAGVNLPMLVETGLFLDSLDSIEQLSKKAVASGIEGVSSALEEEYEDNLDF